MIAILIILKAITSSLQIIIYILERKLLGERVKGAKIKNYKGIY
jgi:hypothetical protein